MAANDPLVKEIYIEASPEEVFQFLIDPAKMVRWLGISVDLDARPGGIFRVDPNGRDVIRGTFLEVTPYSKVVFTWGWEEVGHRVPAGSTTVEIHLEAQGDGTLVRLIHRDLPGAAKESHSGGWSHYLGRLKVVTEGGDPGPDPFATLETHHG